MQEAARKQNSDPELQEIVTAMADAAEDIGKEPCDLQCDEFRAFIGRMRLGITRHAITEKGGFARIRAVHFPPKATKEARLKRKMQVIALANNRDGRRTIDEAETFAEIETWAGRVFGRTKDVTKPIALARKAKASCKEPEINYWDILDTGDWHCGGDLEAKHTGATDYGPQEEARRMGKVIAEVCDYKSEHRRESGLIVVWGGDLIEGEIHPTRAALMWKQIARATHLGFAASEHFARAFRRVHNVCVSGNHGDHALHHKEPDRAWDTHEMSIYQFMRAHMADRPHVTWNIPEAAFATFEVFGKNYYTVHGHTVVHAGNPGQSINMANITQQIDSLNASAIGIGGYSHVFLHHLHSPVDMPLGNGTQLTIDGALTPVSTYAKSIGYHSSACRQFLGEISRDYAMGDQRWITLTVHTDGNEKYSKIVPTWRSP